MTEQERAEVREIISLAVGWADSGEDVLAALSAAGYRITRDAAATPALEHGPPPDIAVSAISVQQHAENVRARILAETGSAQKDQRAVDFIHDMYGDADD